MNNFVPSLIRTYVPLAVAALVTWLASSLHIVIDPSSQAGLVALALSVVFAVYYGGVRLLERRWPKFGHLLGSKAQPVYPPAPPAV